jgi:hypothetical protein
MFNGNGTRRCFVREIGVTLTAATSSSVGLIRPTNTPVGTSTVTPIPEDPADAPATATLSPNTTTTPATIGANVFLRSIILPATIGAGIIWTWPGAGSDKALVVGLGTSSLVFWNFGAGAGSALDIYVVYEE